MRRTISLLLLCLMLLNGCAHWAAVTVPMDLALRPTDAQHVRLHLRDSSMVELRFAVADSAEITGRRDWPVQEWIAVPRDSVVSMAVQRGNGAATAIVLVVGVGLLIWDLNNSTKDLGRDIIGALGGKSR